MKPWLLFVGQYKTKIIPSVNNFHSDYDSYFSAETAKQILMYKNAYLNDYLILDENEFYNCNKLIKNKSEKELFEDLETIKKLREDPLSGWEFV